RAPRRDHIAISIAPVSEPATMPTRQSAGIPRIARERSITSTKRASPTPERCERPTSAVSSISADQPGRLAQGPEEKHGLAGRRVGFIRYSFSQIIKMRPTGARTARDTYGRGAGASMRQHGKILTLSTAFQISPATILMGRATITTLKRKARTP